MAKKSLPAAGVTSGFTSRLTLIVDAQGWKKIPRLNARLQQAAAATLAHLPARLQIPFNATLLLTGDARVRRLNHDFRGIDKPTNVLSFPQFEPRRLPELGKCPEPVEIGDIAIALAYSSKEAKENNKLLINHIIHLVVHGLLHLFGYDHIMDAQANRMEKLETTIMRSLGLPDPYAGEAGARPDAKAKKKNRRRP
ncbi:MAG: rRNA maturation RNase YbeY [Alphaproteobacteria bacterium]|nr:rRNA maturation RNase YbeY [Alphaproteobacteria bacterium]